MEVGFGGKWARHHCPHLTHTANEEDMLSLHCCKKESMGGETIPRDKGNNGEIDALISSPSTSRSPPSIRRQSNACSTKTRFAKVGCTFLLIACTCYKLLHRPPPHRTNQSTPHHNTTHLPNKRRPIYIFGHSTGHSGTGTFHNSLLQKGCPWNTNSTVDEFEYLAENERRWRYDDDNCSLVKERLIPHLVEVVNDDDGAYLDLGHFHNRGKTLPCLAKHFTSQSIFIHIRRNRYDIARSFTESMTRLASSHPEMKITPCIHIAVDNEGVEYGHPHVATCPRSTEDTAVELSIDDDSWDDLSTFQQFLWYADEMEYRWYILQNMFDEDVGIMDKPKFVEVTWNNKGELEYGVNYVRQQLGCKTLEDNNLVNEHPHVQHTEKLNCSQYLWEDLEYRKVMKFDAHHSEVLFDTLPQRVGGGECSESDADLKQKMKEYTTIHGIQYITQQWMFADENGNSK